jgi:hypothetical protein
LGQTVRCTSTPEDLKGGILKITMSVPLPTIVIDFELLPDK